MAHTLDPQLSQKRNDIADARVSVGAPLDVAEHLARPPVELVQRRPERRQILRGQGRQHAEQREPAQGLSLPQIAGLCVCGKDLRFRLAV